MRGVRSAPPELPGFTFVRGLGGGGFADVYLFNQHRPKRRVAIKVLRRDRLTPESLAQFEVEADVMAAVSEHPHIVTIHLTGEAEDGRPYIVMEHCSQQSFDQRLRQGVLSIAETLQVGVQLASAVEVAHRAGILHRDIKPANILTTAFGKPGLTDFGIAGVVAEGQADPALGMSVQWAPAEAFPQEDRITSPPHAVQITSDVYSLAATLYAFLSGHPPYTPPGSDASAAAVEERVRSGELTPLARNGVPRPLEHLLRNALSPRPSDRPQSALDLARTLQDVQRELSLARTPIEVVTGVDDEGEDGPAPTPLDRDDDQTQHQGRPGREAGLGVVVTPRIPQGHAEASRPPAPASLVRPPTARASGDIHHDDTYVPDHTPPEEPSADGVLTTPPTHRPSRRIAIGVGSAAVAAVALVAIVLASGPGASSSGSTTTTQADQVVDSGPLVVADVPPTEVEAAYDETTGDLTVRWTQPPSLADDPTVRYRVYRRDGASVGDELEAQLEGIFSEGVPGDQVVVPGVPAGPDPVCVSVATIAGGRISGESGVSCAPRAETAPTTATSSANTESEG